MGPTVLLRVEPFGTGTYEGEKVEIWEVSNSGAENAAIVYMWFVGCYQVATEEYPSFKVLPAGESRRQVYPPHPGAARSCQWFVSGVVRPVTVACRARPGVVDVVMREPIRSAGRAGAASQRPPPQRGQGDHAGREQRPQPHRGRRRNVAVRHVRSLRPVWCVWKARNARALCRTRDGGQPRVPGLPGSLAAINPRRYP